MNALHGLRFDEPLWLIALVPLALFAWWQKRRGRPALLFASSALFDGAPITAAQRLARWIARGQLLAWALLIVALARPQRGLEEHRVRADGIAIVMAIDRSDSMRALDFELDGKREDRLTVVPLVIFCGPPLAGLPTSSFSIRSNASLSTMRSWSFRSRR